jgi:rhodanese-related sulfurtransferase
MSTQTPAPTSTPVIVAAELTRRLAGDHPPRVIDVRTPGEFESGHIPGSVNVPLDVIGTHAAELASLDETVVVVCQSGARASRACAALSGAGSPSLLRLDGGIAAWSAAGGQVERLRERWSLERQVRLVAGAIVLVAVAVSAFVPWTKWLAGLVGAGLTFAAISNTCAMGMLLAKLPYNRGAACDIGVAMRALRSESAR